MKRLVAARFASMQTLLLSAIRHRSQRSEDGADTVLEQIGSEVERLARIIGASGYVLPTYGRSDDGGRPHIMVDSAGYHYVVVERGQELRRLTTCSLDDLLYHVFAAVTFSMAGEFEVAHRIKLQDCRRALFRRQIDLLSLLSPGWAHRQLIEHDRILRENPFDDLALARAVLCKQLRDQGRSADDAWRAACGHYPLPSVYNQ